MEPPLFCGLCGTVLPNGAAGRCANCGAVTTVTLDAAAQERRAALERTRADFDAMWRELTPEERRAAVKRVQGRATRAWASRGRSDL